MTETQTHLAAAFPTLKWEWDKVLADRTYFHVGGPAEAYVELNDEAALVALVAFCRQHSIRVTLLGGASNVVVADEGVTGVVVHLTNDQVTLTERDDATATVLVGAGCKMALLVSQTVKAGYAGLEYFLGVPGTVGGAVYNNAHYLAHLIGEHISRVKIITGESELVWLSQVECEFGYDSSRFQRTKEIIVAAEFSLPKGDLAQSQQLIKEATVYRAETQPLGEPSSGCIFQNVPATPELLARFPQFASKSHISGGFLIDQAGLKGKRVGDIEVSHKHAAFFVNKGQGTAQQVKELVNIVKTTVKEKLNVDLQEEVFYLN